MNIASKLAVRLFVLAIPFTALAWFLLSSERLATMDQNAAEQLHARMTDEVLTACESDPGGWPFGPLGRSDNIRRLAAYGADFASANALSPALPEDVQKGLTAGDRFASTEIESDGQRVRVVAIAVGDATGACAYAAQFRQVLADSTQAGRTFTTAISAGLMAAMLALFAATPLVRRIRLLTYRVGRSEEAPDESIALDGKDEIAELSRVFEANRAQIREQIEALEARDNALRAHIADTSHDVLTPLSVLQGHLAELAKHVEEDSASSLREARATCQYIGELVNNLGARAKLEAALSKEAVDMCRLVERVSARYRPLAAQNRVNLDFAVPREELEVAGDITLIEQALGNLIHNAVVYNRSGGNVAVVLEGNGSGFELRITDDGPGVSPDELANLRERNFRGKDAKAKRAGSGFGLDIASRVAEQHGWSLDIRCPDSGGLEAVLRTES